MLLALILEIQTRPTCRSLTPAASSKSSGRTVLCSDGLFPKDCPLHWFSKLPLTLRQSNASLYAGMSGILLNRGILNYSVTRLRW